MQQIMLISLHFLSSNKLSTFLHANCYIFLKVQHLKIPSLVMTLYSSSVWYTYMRINLFIGIFSRGLRNSNAGLMFTCPQRDKRSTARVWMMYCHHIESSAVVNFLDRKYRYKSLASHIPHDARFLLTPFTGQTFLPHQRYVP